MLPRYKLPLAINREVLGFTNQSGITHTWDNATGTLSLSGSATKAQYETALESITYNNTSDTPNTSNRTVTWIVNDGTASSTGITSTITVAAVNDAPTLAGGANVLQFSEGDSAIVVNNALTLSDLESTAVNRVQVVLAGSGSGEQLNFTDTSKIEGSWSSGTLTLSAISGQSPTNAEFQAAIRTITYSNTDTSTADGNRTATFTAYEGSGTGLASSAAVTTISVATLDDDAPTLGGLSGSAVAYTESDAATQLESGLTVADTDDDNLEKAIIRISAGFATGEDVLAATVGSTGLTATYTASTGTLEITGTGTKAEYQEVLRTVTYDNTNDDDPSTSARTIIWQLFDGANYSSAGTTTVNITAVNDAPTGADAGATLAFTEGDGASVIDNFPDTCRC